MADRVVGRVALLQIQRSTLKYDHRYDPTPLLGVPEVIITPKGVLGAADGGWMVDAHHADHPFARARGLRPLSIGFTSHYAAISARFGEVPLGIAGENIVVDTHRRWTALDLGQGVVVNRTELPNPRVATPCLEFTSFLLGLPHRADRHHVADEMDYLDEGTRGFLLDVGRIREPLRVAVGDLVTLAG